MARIAIPEQFLTMRLFISIFELDYMFKQLTKGEKLESQIIFYNNIIDSFLMVWISSIPFEVKQALSIIERWLIFKSDTIWIHKAEPPNLEIDAYMLVFKIVSFYDYT